MLPWGFGIHAEYRDMDKRIGGISFESDKDPEHLALQAADLSAIHFRNSARDYIETDGAHINQRHIMFIKIRIASAALKKSNKLYDSENKTAELGGRRQKRTTPLYPIKERNKKKTSSITGQQILSYSTTRLGRVTKNEAPLCRAGLYFTVVSKIPVIT